jgi:hypothetical protein
MLLTNQRIDKMAAARVDFESRGMLNSTQGNPLPGRRPIPQVHSNAQELAEGVEAEEVDTEDVEGVTSEGDVRLPRHAGACIKTDTRVRLKTYYSLGYPKTLAHLSQHLGLPQLEEHIRRFLYDQENPNSNIFGMDIELNACPQVSSTLRIDVYHSASTLYHAPSDLSGIGGMHREYIRATLSWKHGDARHDCVFIEKDADEVGFRALGVAQVQTFLSFYHNDKKYSCALVRWFEAVGDAPCPNTCMWIVQPDIYIRSRRRICTIVHINSILRAAHLIGIGGPTFLPQKISPSQSLYAFKSFYVNKYADHHSYELDISPCRLVVKTHRFDSESPGNDQFFIENMKCWCLGP